MQMVRLRRTLLMETGRVYIHLCALWSDTEEDWGAYWSLLSGFPCGIALPMLGPRATCSFNSSG